MPRARKAGSAFFNVAMTSSRRMTSSYQSMLLDSSVGFLTGGGTVGEG
jgi:hypothetical protein